MWTPTADEIKKTHIQQALESHHLDSYEQLHADSVQNWESFWQSMIAQFKIRFFKSPDATADISQGIERISWLPGAELNIAASALESREPEFKAIEFQRPNGSRESWSYAELNQKSRHVAEGLKRLGLQKGDAIAIDMMMTVESVAIYLGIILMGGVVVSIADSFPAEEIAKRLRISNAKLIFTQDFLLRGEKTFPLFERIVAANSPPAIVLSLREKGTVSLRSGDLFWSEFLPQEELKEAAKCLAEDPINILFSSGTTGDPKAIPWNHTTPIKAASDAFWHHNLQEGDIVCWPTNLGWMMGPWLIFASLLNRCTIALFEGSPLEREFCEFVTDSRVTMLGVVPSLVKNWRKNKLLEAVDWSYIKCFSSTGEASSPEDYTWLMSAGQKPNVTRPILEYCGGTEIGGAYISSALTKPNEPSIFNAKVMGVDLVVLNDLGHPCSQGEVGEVFLKTPSMGLSTRLLNRDHHKIYFEGCPEGLRRHGDRLRILGSERYCSDGRADNTMNLGGIKTSSAEIEAALRGIPEILEVAAVGVPPKAGGPDQLILYVVLKQPSDLIELQGKCQKSLSANLNPLFRIHEVRLLEHLPRTASNKVMHRELRDRARC